MQIVSKLTLRLTEHFVIASITYQVAVLRITLKSLPQKDL